MQIFREYGEVVLTIGSAYRLTNRAIFGDADLACGVSMLPGQHKHIAATEMASIQELPMGSYSALSRLDMLLVFRLIRLNAPSLLQVPCALVPLHQLTEQSHSIAKEIQEPVMDFSSLLEAIRMGRIFVLNATQALGTLCVCLVSLAMSPCVAFLAPLTIPSFLPLPIVLLFLFLYIPLLLLSMLFTRASSHDTVMRNTPRKRRMVRKPAEEGRFKSYLAMRCLTVLVTMALMQWLTTASLYGDSNIRFTDRYSSITLSRRIIPQPSIV